MISWTLKEVKHDSKMSDQISVLRQLIIRYNGIVMSLIFVRSGGLPSS
jgi:hypothetical protein